MDKILYAIAWAATASLGGSTGVTQVGQPAPLPPTCVMVTADSAIQSKLTADVEKACKFTVEANPELKAYELRMRYDGAGNMIYLGCEFRSKVPVSALRVQFCRDVHGKAELIP